MKKLFYGVYASVTLGILLREFAHGHVRQLAGDDQDQPYNTSTVQVLQRPLETAHLS